MTFSVYAGTEIEACSWADLMHRFATWTGLALCVERRSMPDRRQVCLAVMKHPAAGQGRMTVHVDESLIAAWPGGGAGQYSAESTAEIWRKIEDPAGRNEVQLAVMLQSGELRVNLPIATPEQIFYSNNARGFMLANDMRLAMNWADAGLRSSSLFSLFQYGMVPATLSLSQSVVRIPPGHVFRTRLGSNSVAYSPLPGPIEGQDRESPGIESEALLLNALDSRLEQLPEGSMLYFSGGVDSSLLASRIARIGRHDIVLINFAFGHDDSEGQLALKVASHLGLRCEQMMYASADLDGLLSRLGRDYSYPFGDDSTIPTNLLVHATARTGASGRTVVEGTGADGGFGPVVRGSRQWRWLYLTPSFVRRGLGETYRWFRLWERNLSVPKARVLASVARQTTCMPLAVAAVLSSNALDGIAYSMSPEIRDELAEALEYPVRQWGAALNRGERFALLDLIHVCAGRFAAKSFDPLRQAGLDPVYPYLEPDLLRVSFRLPWEEKVRGEGKALLKRLLAREVPRDWVYRRKSAFDAPLNSVLAEQCVQEFFHSVVLSNKNPVLDYLEKDVVKRMVSRCRELAPLEISVRRFLWTILFVSAWLSDVRAITRGTGAVSRGHR